MADLELPAAIRRIDLQAPSLVAEVEALLQPFIGQTRISGRELERMRGEIWNLYRQRGRITRVELRAIAGGAAAEGSVLQVRILEYGLRAITVESEGDAAVSETVRARLLADARAQIVENGPLDLERLDRGIKRRIFLGDVDVRATLVPADQDQVDVRFLVAAKPVVPLAMLAQYDNSGSVSYGRDRFTAGVSIPGRMQPGDRLDVIGIRTKGMSYGRIAYEFPFVRAGVRLAAWNSYVGYRVPGETKGNTAQFGAGVIRPLHLGNSAVWMGRLNYNHTRQRDRLADGPPTGDKRINLVQGKIEASFYPRPAHTLRFSLALSGGELDLSALPAALIQDQASAQTDGAFAKLEWDGGWRGLFGRAGRLDVGVSLHGQLAPQNLDQSEKFALGGPNGVRAYGPVEALGDDAGLASVELGFRPARWLRTFAFYDLGRTRRYRDPWTTEAIPLEYTLQGAGAGLGFSHKKLVGSIAYARQIGDNPGLQANGQDSDGVRDRHRLWVTLTLWW